MSPLSGTQSNKIVLICYLVDNCSHKFYCSRDFSIAIAWQKLFRIWPHLFFLAKAQKDSLFLACLGRVLWQKYSTLWSVVPLSMFVVLWHSFFGPCLMIHLIHHSFKLVDHLDSCTEQSFSCQLDIPFLAILENLAFKGRPSSIQDICHSCPAEGEGIPYFKDLNLAS